MMDVKDTKIVSVDDVIGILEEHKGSELSYEQTLALQHAKKFAIARSKNDKLKKELEAMGLLNEKSVIKILEVMPKNQMTLRQILAQERKTFSDEEVTKILAMTKDKG